MTPDQHFRISLSLVSYSKLVFFDGTVSSICKQNETCFYYCELEVKRSKMMFEEVKSKNEIVEGG